MAKRFTLGDSSLRVQLDGRSVSEQIDALQFKLDPSSTNTSQTYLNARVSCAFGALQSSTNQCAPSDGTTLFGVPARMSF